MAKKKYKTNNWSEYDKSLVQRGYITILLSQKSIAQWSPNKPTKKGRPEKYNDVAIETMLIIKTVFNFDNRRTEGFLRSLFKMLNIDLPVPDQTIHTIP